ncbi:MAG: hypothetical protein JRI59_08410 [Deltaproteobacteria bacterium]|nr:hypothetical protein [Deltaproteobacteria bacterium]
MKNQISPITQKALSAFRKMESYRLAAEKAERHLHELVVHVPNEDMNHYMNETEKIVRYYANERVRSGLIRVD